jgi:hypothetical protein
MRLTPTWKIPHKRDSIASCMIWISILGILVAGDGTAGRDLALGPDEVAIAIARIGCRPELLTPIMAESARDHVCGGDVCFLGKG